MSTEKIPQPPDDNNPTPVDVLSGIALELEELARGGFTAAPGFSEDYEPLLAIAAKARNAAQIAMNSQPRRRMPVCFSHLRELVLEVRHNWDAMHDDAAYALDQLIASTPVAERNDRELIAEKHGERYGEGARALHQLDLALDGWHTWLRARGVLADFERECEAEHEQRGAP